MADAALTVTLKAGKGYEAHWVVFKGGSVQEVRSHIEDYFEFEPNEALTLNEVVAQAEATIQGTANVLREFKGSVVKSEKTDAGSGNKAEPAPVAESASDSEQQSPAEALAAKMATAATVDDLRALWVDNKALYDEHKIVKDAYSKRGRELTET